MYDWWALKLAVGDFGVHLIYNKSKYSYTAVSVKPNSLQRNHYCSLIYHLNNTFAFLLNVTRDFIQLQTGLLISLFIINDSLIFTHISVFNSWLLKTYLWIKKKINKNINAMQKVSKRNSYNFHKINFVIFFFSIIAFSLSGFYNSIYNNASLFESRKSVIFIYKNNTHTHSHRNLLL